MNSVLVIEDDADYRDLIKFGLDESGYDVEVASSAKIGLNLSNKKEYDIIICDVLMPEMDGLEFLLEVKKNKLKAKTIMISGGGVKKNKIYLESSTGMGCDAVLDKPFTINRLENLIETML